MSKPRKNKLTQDEVERFIDDTSSDNLPATVDLNDINYIVRYVSDGSYYYHPTLDDIQWNRLIKDLIIDYGENDCWLWRRGRWQSGQSETYRKKANWTFQGATDFRASCEVSEESEAEEYYTHHRHDYSQSYNFVIPKIYDVQIDKLPRDLTSEIDIATINDNQCNILKFGKTSTSGNSLARIPRNKFTTKTNKSLLSFSALREITVDFQDSIHSYVGSFFNCPLVSERLHNIFPDGFINHIQSVAMNRMDCAYKAEGKDLSILEDCKTTLVELLVIRFKYRICAIYLDFRWYLGILADN